MHCLAQTSLFAPNYSSNNIDTDSRGIGTHCSSHVVLGWRRRGGSLFQQTRNPTHMNLRVLAGADEQPIETSQCCPQLQAQVAIHPRDGLN